MIPDCDKGTVQELMSTFTGCPTWKFKTDSGVVKMDKIYTAKKVSQLEH